MNTSALYFVVPLLIVEVCLLESCTADDALIREETLNLLSGGRYILKDGECHAHAPPSVTSRHWPNIPRLPMMRATIKVYRFLAEKVPE